MSEPRIVTPQEARACEYDIRLAVDVSTLIHTVATEPDRIAEAERRGAVKALRQESRRWFGPYGPANSAQTSSWLQDRAKAYENGSADL